MDYEATRRRHFAHAMELLPSYVARLGWSRREIVAEQTDALRALLRHAIASSSWHREHRRVARADVDGGAIRTALERRLASVGLGARRVVVRRVDAIDRQKTGS